ncbi:hypothetical protein Ahy_A07g034028 [Arachis hypogaea]|uniref:Putative plant transposon protein domain-containing protein n=1 Tax=Arachis hypogaea TaxID=3818 RepID=A0A445CAQ2_ARAHY|nr:hypothetical protein Ahy_A07g034028 [Arachis hypogaea]
MHHEPHSRELGLSWANIVPWAQPDLCERMHRAGAPFHNSSMDNPSSRSTLRSCATLSPTSTLSFFFSPPTAVATAAPVAAARPTSVTVLGHQLPFPLTTTRSLSLPLTPLTHLTLPSAATPSSLPAASPSLFFLHLLLSFSSLTITLPPPLSFSSLRPNHRASRPHRHRSRRCQVLSLLPLPYHRSPFHSQFFPAPRMSDRGKAIASASKKRKRSKTSTPPPSANYARNPLNEEEKENQLLPSTDPTKFPNLYCELRLSQVALLSLTFDYEALRRVIATPDASWVMDSSNTKPKGMLFAHLTREARTWQQIFARYVFPTTHFSEIPMDMLVLIGCVMEGKEVYFPRLIRHSMWRAHIRGLLPFPTLVTSLAELADVPWEDDDVTPPPPDDDDKEVTIPWGVWVHERPPTSRRSRARAAVEAATPSSLPAAPPPSAPEPTYLLVQRLFRFLERERLHVKRRLDRMDQALISLGAELPPLPDSPTSDEPDHQEKDAEAPAQQDAPDTTEPPQTQEEPVPQPQPQSEPEPIVVPPTDPPV